MNRKLSYSFLALAIFIAPEVILSVARAQNNVTLRVNMSIMMREGKFQPGSSDIVRVAGGFNNWGSSTDTLKSTGPTDSIYTKTVSLATGAIQYKFLKTLRGGLDWEGDQPTASKNREYTVASGVQTLPVVWFNNDSVFVAAAQVPATFRVNMRVKILEGSFRADLGDIVRVAGGFNNWGSSTDTLKRGTADSIYSKTINLQEGSAIQYKFLKTLRAGLDWESSPPTSSGNREYTVPTGGGTIPLVYFDNDSVVNTPISGNILWRVNMTTYSQLGWFRRTSGDSMEVRGPFNGWNGNKMSRVPGTETYELSLPYSGFTFDDVDYKYFMRLDSAGAVARFPGWNNNRDGVNYEHPAERGDGNRKLNYSTGGNLQAPLYNFSSIPTAGIIKAGDTVTVTFRYDMRPSMRYIDPFNKATDVAKIVWQDALSKAAQGNPPDLILKDDGIAPDAVAGDSIYSGRMNIVGPAHYNLQYTLTYTHAAGGAVSEGGGLGVQNPFRSRFVQPIAAQKWPRNYTSPIDVWQKGAPMPAETPPFDPLSDVAIGENVGPPVVYTLFQNYPNPFNPSTLIRYTLPREAHVRLSVFNLLGQEIALLINELQPAGNYVALFEPKGLPSGVYFYHLEAGSFHDVKKMLLLK